MLSNPRRYYQRVVDTVSFLPQGGQQWRREIQVQLPHIVEPATGAVGTASRAPMAATEVRYIVSLGMYERKRFPDFSVRSPSGEPIRLLTRFEHGQCLTELMLTHYLHQANIDTAGSANLERVAEASAGLSILLFRLFTTTTTRPAESVGEAAELLESILRGYDVEDTRVAAVSRLFREDYPKLGGATQYLCFVTGSPGSVLHLSTSHSMGDPRSLKPKKRRGRDRLTALYAASGLAPHQYEYVIPAHDHAASYYFTIEPPSDSTLMYLDWGASNSLSERARGEWSCSSESLHIYNGPKLVSQYSGDAGCLTDGVRDSDDGPANAQGVTARAQPLQQIQFSKVFAFFRPNPRDHKRIVIGALLNIFFVCLILSGSANTDFSSSTTVLLLGPAALLAYVAYQKRHYFSQSTRWLRLVIWSYIVINVLFLASVAFEVPSNASGLGEVSDRASAGLMIGASVAMVMLFGPAGDMYHKVIDWLHGRWLTRKGPKAFTSTKRGVPRSARAYVRAVRRYGHAVALAAITSTAVALLAMFQWNLIPDSPGELGADSECREFLQASEEDMIAAIARISDELGVPLGQRSLRDVESRCFVDQDKGIGPVVRASAHQGYSRTR